MRSGSAFRSVCTLSRPFTGAEAEAERRAERAGGEPGKGERRERRERRESGEKSDWNEAAERGSTSIVEMEAMSCIAGGPKVGRKEGQSRTRKRSRGEPMSSRENPRNKARVDMTCVECVRVGIGIGSADPRVQASIRDTKHIRAT